MKKKILIITAVFLLVAVTVCLVPRPVQVRANLNAVKLDAEGNQLGAVQINIDGFLLKYLLRTDRLDATVTFYDGLKNIQTDGKVSAGNNGDWLEVQYTAWGTVYDDIHPILLRFSRELDRWMLWDQKSDVYYVASTDGSAATQELAEFFMIPKQNG